MPVAENHADQPHSLRTAGLIAAIASISVVGMNIGLGLPLLSITLSRLGYTNAQIGANTIMGGVGALVVMPFIATIARRIGAAPLLFIALVVSAVSFLCFYLTDDIRGWLILRVFYHGSIAVAFSVSEFWISAAANEKRRGLLLGVYGAMLAIGFSLGPVLLNTLGSNGPLPFVVGTSIMVAASLPVLLALKASPSMHSEEHGHFFKFISEFPEATLAVLAFGIVETGAMAMVTVYGLSLGYDANSAALLLLALSAGNIVSQIPMGYVTDKVERRKLLVAVSLIGTLALTLLPLARNFPTGVFVLITLAAAVVPALYMCGLQEIAKRLRGAEQASGNASYVMLYAIGGLIGPTLFGIGLDHYQSSGFALVGAATLGLFGIFMIIRVFWHDNS